MDDSTDKDRKTLVNISRSTAAAEFMTLQVLKALRCKEILCSSIVLGDLGDKTPFWRTFPEYGFSKPRVNID